MPFRIAERMPALVALPAEAMLRKALIRAGKTSQTAGTLDQNGGSSLAAKPGEPLLYLRKSVLPYFSVRNCQQWLKQRRYRFQAATFVKTKNYVHVLYRLACGTLYHIVNGACDNQGAPALI